MTSRTAETREATETRLATLTWEPTGLRVDVPMHKPLLFGLLDAGVPLAFDCMQGHCRRCRATLTKGAVLRTARGRPVVSGSRHADDPNPYPSHRRTILLCSTYAASQHLSLALHP